MRNDDGPTGGARHAASAARPGGRAPMLVAVATAVGVWLGVSAPEVSPVSAPAPAVQTPQTEPAPPARGPAR
jgi:hypothetical protein